MTESYDTSVWRLKGDPLVPAAGPGPLSGQSVAVKDLFAVAGQPIGAGNPTWLAEATPEAEHAPAVLALVNAGAQITGVSQTDEFAFSIAGTNAHFGTPPNPAAPGRIPGGSSSGSATAVSLGEVSIGLGTDTGGSVRVPAAYQGLWGIRTTHGLVPTGGVHPLAPTFDTVGWVTRTPELLAAAAEAIIPVPKLPQPSAPAALGGMGTSSSIPVVPRTPVPWGADHRLGELKIASGAFATADDDVASAARNAIGQYERLTGQNAAEVSGLDEELLTGWLGVFRVIQSYEAWAADGEWVAQHWDDLAPDVGARFRAAQGFTGDQADQARLELKGIRARIRAWVGDGVLAVPSAATLPPTVEDAGFGSEVVETARRRTMQLTCIAGLSGLPAVNVPVTTASGLPAGLSLVGPAGSDMALIRYAAQIVEVG